MTAISSPATAGPMMRVPLNSGGVEAHGARDVLAADHLDHERLADGHVERVHDAQAERQHEHLPHLDSPRHDEHAQEERQARPRRPGWR